MYNHLARADQKYALLVVGTGTAYTGLAIISAHTGVFSPVPFVLHFYAEQGKEELADAVFAWGDARGYSTAWAINATTLDDETWMALIQEAMPDRRIRRFGAMMEFTTR